MPRAFPSHAPDDDLVDRFAAAMRPYAPEPYSRDKAREGLGNLLEFLGLLERWDAEDRAGAERGAASSADPGAPAAPEGSG